MYFYCVKPIIQTWFYQWILWFVLLWKENLCLLIIIIDYHLPSLKSQSFKDDQSSQERWKLYCIKDYYYYYYMFIVIIAGILCLRRRKSNTDFLQKEDTANYVTAEKNNSKKQEPRNGLTFALSQSLNPAELQAAASLSLTDHTRQY